MIKVLDQVRSEPDLTIIVIIFLFDFIYMIVFFMIIKDNSFFRGGNNIGSFSYSPWYFEFSKFLFKITNMHSSL